MSTISTLVVKIAGDNSGFLKSAQSAIQAAERITAGIIKNNVAVKAVTGAYNAADNALRKYGATMKQVAAVAGSAVAAKGVIGGIKAQLAASASGELSNAFKGVRTALENASSAFGKSFASWGNLAGIAHQLANVIERLTPLFSALGAVVGVVFRIFSALLPVLVLAGIALKALAAVIGVLVHVLLGKLIVRTATWLILGKSMGSIALALRLAKLGWAAAIWAVNGSLAALEAIGVPAILAIGVALAPIIATLAVFAGAVAIAYFSWKALSGDNAQLNQIAQMEKVRAATHEATKELRDFMDELDRKTAQVGLRDAAKEAMKLKEMLDRAQKKSDELGGTFDRASYEKQITAQQKLLSAAENRAAVAAKLVELQKQLNDAGKDDVLKARDAIRSLGGSENDQNAAVLLAQQIQAKQKAFDLEKQIRDIEREAQFAGLSELERRIVMLREASATEEQIASIRARYEAASAATQQAETRAKLEAEIARIQQDAAQAFLTDGEKRIEQLRQLGATAEQIAAAMKQVEMVDAAKQARQIIESTRTPLEQAQAKMEQLETLLKGGLIDQLTYNRAVAAEREKLEGKVGGRVNRIAEQGGAVLRGSQADIAARFRDSPELKTNQQILETDRQQLTVLEKIHGKLETPPPFQIAELN